MSQGYNEIDKPRLRSRDVGIPFSAEASLTVVATQACISIIWIILFAVVVFHLNPSCTDPIYQWNIDAIKIFVSIIIIQIIALIIVFVLLQNRKELALQLTSILLLIITALLLIYVWIDGIILMSDSTPIENCEALYYLDLIYLIIAGIDATCIIILPLSYLLCCGLLKYLGVLDSVLQKKYATPIQ